LTWSVTSGAGTYAYTGTDLFRYLKHDGFVTMTLRSDRLAMLANTGQAAGHSFWFVSTKDPMVVASLAQTHGTYAVIDAGVPQVLLAADRFIEQAKTAPVVPGAPPTAPSAPPRPEIPEPVVVPSPKPSLLLSPAAIKLIAQAPQLQQQQQMPVVLSPELLSKFLAARPEQPEPEKAAVDWKPILIVGGVVIVLVAAGYYLATRKS
jgi:hypothetical protein